MFYYIFHIGFSLDLELSNGEKIKHRELADKKKRASVNYTDALLIFSKIHY
jgi:hypothetical protein